MAKHKLLRLQKNNSFARQHISGCFKKTHIAMAVCSALLTPLTVYALPLANDLPTGGLVTTGAATIQQNGNALTIHQVSRPTSLGRVLILVAMPVLHLCSPLQRHSLLIVFMM
mgnify:CR=1 FL=1